MPKIRILTDATINQIAAGEVIENPASVVKELVENSIDAGSTRVRIGIKAGGFQQIEVSDDGCGMDGDDALLSLERHATSKIAKAEDLASLSSMGFRGEALASIAAVSKLEMITATEGRSGLRLNLKEGVMPHPRNRGTTVEVHALFYNVPARKKFQKSPARAFVDVQKLLVSLALAHPRIGFTFYHQESEIFAEQPDFESPFLQVLERRVSKLVGAGYTTALSYKEGPYAIQGVIGAPAETRPNRMGQYLFINGRPVASLPISFAVKEAYGTRIDPSRHPIFVLHINVDPKLVDVNVHPQKKEVRFQNETAVRAFVKTAVIRSFGHSVESYSIHRGNQKSVNGNVGASGLQQAPPLAKQAMCKHMVDAASCKNEDADEASSRFLIPDVYSSAPFVFGELPSSSFRFREMAAFEAPHFLEEEPLVLGLFDHYLLLDGRSVKQYGSGILFVDLLQAQEELAYSELTDVDKPIFSQQLLLAPTLSLSCSEAKEIEIRREEFAKNGIVLTRIGKESFSIDAIPPFLSVEEAPDAVRALLERADDCRALAHFARSKKKSFMLQEGIAIAKKLLKNPFAMGPKTLYHMSCDALQKSFKV